MQNNLKSLQEKIKDLQTKLKGVDTPIEEDSKLESRDSSYMVATERQTNKSTTDNMKSKNHKD